MTPRLPLLFLTLPDALLRLWPWLLGKLLMLHGDFHAAGMNCRRLLRERPAVAQTLLALWPLLFGLNALVNGNALYAIAPHVYGWLHTGPLFWLPARALGLGQIALALWQFWALVWPIKRRVPAMRLAVRFLCGTNAGFMLGYLLAVPHGASWQFYGLQLAGSAWCLWRLADTKTVIALTEEGHQSRQVPAH